MCVCVCALTLLSVLHACVVNKLREEISHVRRRSTGKHASKPYLPFSILSFFRFDNVRLNIDALKFLQSLRREGEFYFGNIPKEQINFYFNQVKQLVKEEKIFFFNILIFLSAYFNGCISTFSG